MRHGIMLKVGSTPAIFFFFFFFFYICHIWKDSEAKNSWFIRGTSLIKHPEVYLQYIRYSMTIAGLSKGNIRPSTAANTRAHTTGKYLVWLVTTSWSQSDPLLRWSGWRLHHNWNWWLNLFLFRLSYVGPNDLRGSLFLCLRIYALFTGKNQYARALLCN